jgi:CRP-like cAMP-binding protein
MEDLLQNWLDEVLGAELQGSAAALLDGGMPPEQVATQLGLTTQEVLRLAEEQRAQSEEERA